MRRLQIVIPIVAVAVAALAYLLSGSGGPAVDGRSGARNRVPDPVVEPGRPSDRDPSTHAIPTQGAKPDAAGSARQGNPVVTPNDLILAILHMVKRGSCRDAVDYLKNVVARPARTVSERILRATAVRCLPYVASVDPALKQELYIYVKGLILDPDEWSRCTALGALFGLNITFLETRPGGVRVAIKNELGPDPTRIGTYSFHDEAKRDPESAGIIDRALRHSSTPEAKQAALYTIGNLLDWENPQSEFLATLEYAMTYEQDRELQEAVIMYLLPYPVEQAYPIVERLLQKPGPTTPNALLWMAQKGAWPPGAGELVNGLLMSKQVEAPEGSVGYDYYLMKKRAAFAVSTLYENTRDKTAHAMIVNVLMSPPDATTLERMCDALAEHGDASFAPCLRAAEANGYPFATTDTIRRALELLDPEYRGTQSLWLAIERLEKRLEENGLSDQERSDLKTRAAELKAEYYHRAEK